MIKKDLLKLIDICIKKDENNRIVNYKKVGYLGYEPLKLPSHPDLDKYLEVLNKEIEERKDIYNESVKELEKYKYNCDHLVRLKYYGIFGSSHTTCIFCNKTIGIGVNSHCLYDNKNRNTYYVSFKGKDRDEDGNLIEGYTKIELFNMILDIIKDKADDEEIDLVYEIKKLNLKKCEVVEKKKEDGIYILVIGGTNTHYIGNNARIIRDSIYDSVKLAKGLANNPYINVDLIDSKDNIDKEELEDTDNFAFTYYSTIDGIKDMLQRRKDIPYDLVIDYTDLYEYKVQEDKIKQVKYEIDLKSIFNNSLIMRFNNVFINDRVMLLHLKEKLLYYDYYYVYTLGNGTSNIINKYKYLVNSVSGEEMATSTDLNSIYKKIKKLVIEKSNH